MLFTLAANNTLDSFSDGIDHVKDGGISQFKLTATGLSVQHQDFTKAKTAEVKFGYASVDTKVTYNICDVYGECKSDEQSIKVVSRATDKLVLSVTDSDYRYVSNGNRTFTLSAEDKNNYVSTGIYAGDFYFYDLGYYASEANDLIYEATKYQDQRDTIVKENPKLFKKNSLFKQGVLNWRLNVQNVRE